MYLEGLFACEGIHPDQRVLFCEFSKYGIEGRWKVNPVPSLLRSDRILPVLPALDVHPLLPDLDHWNCLCSARSICMGMAHIRPSYGRQALAPQELAFGTVEKC